MLSRMAMVRKQLKQVELGQQGVRPEGRRAMQTFRKLPMDAPMKKSHANKSAGQTYTDMRNSPSDRKNAGCTMPPARLPSLRTRALPAFRCKGPS
jgi:hypothetical protein